MQLMRLNKFLSDAGICSRREADRLAAEGRITIDGRPALIGEKVSADQTIRVDGEVISREEKKVILAFHKPRGVVCTAEKREKNNIIDYIGYPIRVYPIGRLDKESEGLILLTNQGEIVNKIMRSGNQHEKEYIVTVNKPLTDKFLQGMANGVHLKELNRTTRKCRVRELDDREFSIVLTQGLNRQIRRMCQAFGYEVVRLRRVRVMNIELGDLQEGTYRELAEEERKLLLLLIRDSSNLTVLE